MTPLRLLILAILFYVGWRLFRGSFLKKQPGAEADNNLGSQDVLVEDPVCRVLIPKHQALRFRKDGVTYYFCSEQCCDQFAGKPEEGEL